MLIDAANSPPPPAQSPAKVKDVISRIEHDATARGLGRCSWLAIVIATTMTMDLPESIAAVAQHVVGSVPPNESIKVVEFMREVGMICIAMNGVRPEAELDLCGS